MKVSVMLPALELSVILQSVSMAIVLVTIYRGRYNKPVTPVTLGLYLMALMLWLAV